MIPSPFRHLLVGHIDEAVAALIEHGEEAKVLAGGQSLIPLMKLRLASPTIVVDLARLGLTGVRVDDRHLVIDALTTYRDVARSPLVREHAPVLAAAASVVGDPQVRNRGTIGGGIAHADPAGDVPCALLALGGAVVARGSKGTRTLDVDGFFVGYLKSALHADEILTEVRIPLSGSLGWDYQKFNIRSQDWATVAVAVTGNRIALASMADRVVRAARSEELLSTGASPTDIAAAVDTDTEPPSDLRASSEYRRHLARVLASDALAGAAGRRR